MKGVVSARRRGASLCGQPWSSGAIVATMTPCGSTSNFIKAFTATPKYDIIYVSGRILTNIVAAHSSGKLVET